MVNNLFKCLLFCLLCYSQIATAQVRGINYTLSPVGEYVLWNKKAGLDNSFLIGGKLGFGFGETLELRGSYMESINQKTRFSDFGIPNYTDSLFTARDAKVTRWGGELKANVGKGAILPYLLAGTGVQSIQLDTFDANKQIFINVGAGIQVSLKNRISLGLEVRNTGYRYNAGKNLLTAADQTGLGVTNADFDLEDLNNWSIGASLQIYLGGSNPEKMSAIDKAYYDRVTKSYKNIGYAIEPSIGKVYFDKSLPFRNAWLAGGTAGVNFGPFVGLRGFYWQALESGETTKFDKLAMYGGELQMNLNTATGIIPYITVGGGNIDIEENNYTGRIVTVNDSIRNVLPAEDKGFAMGGLGLVVPISKGFRIFGTARAILTTGSATDDFQEPDQLQTSWMFNAGIKLSLGKRSDNPEDLISLKVDDALEDQRIVNEQKTAELIEKYESKVVDLEGQLNDALINEDYEAAAEIKKEQEKAEEVVVELEKRHEEMKEEIEIIKEEQKVVTTTETQPAQNTNQGGINIVPSNSEIRMSPAEFENLIEEVLEGINGGYDPYMSPYGMGQPVQPSGGMMPYGNTSDPATNNRISTVEQQMSELMMRQDSMEKTLKSDLQEIKDAVSPKKSSKPEKGSKETGDLKKKDKGETVKSELIDPTYDSPDFQETMGEKNIFRKVRYGGMAGFGGINLGDDTSINAGLRWFYKLGDKETFIFMPETFIGFGSPASFGLSGNFLFPIKFKALPIKPYIGAGYGLMQLEQNSVTKLRGALNLIAGSFIQIKKGQIFVDVIGRNFLNNIQIAGGYRFPF